MPRTKNGGWGPDRPRVTGECVCSETAPPWPCPWLGCRYHVLVDVHATGSLRVNAGELVTYRVHNWKQYAIAKRAPAAVKITTHPKNRKELEIAEMAIMERLEKAVEAGESLCSLEYANRWARRRGGNGRSRVDARPVATFEEVARLFGVSRERIRQIEAAAMPKLRAALENA